MGLRLQDRAFDMKRPAHLRAKLQGSRSRFVIHSRLWVYEHDKKGSRCLRRACGSLSKERQSLGVRPKRRQEGDDRALNINICEKGNNVYGFILAVGKLENETQDDGKEAAGRHRGRN